MRNDCRLALPFTIFGSIDWARRRGFVLFPISFFVVGRCLGAWYKGGGK
jgi:hypothetical protein